jgi:hypothetical protein
MLSYKYISTALILWFYGKTKAEGKEEHGSCTGNIARRAYQ